MVEKTLQDNEYCKTKASIPNGSLVFPIIAPVKVIAANETYTH